MVKNGQKWPKMVKNGQNWSLQCTDPDPDPGKETTSDQNEKG